MISKMSAALSRLFNASEKTSGSAQTPVARMIDEAFWIVLGREVGEIEMRDLSREFHEGDSAALAQRLLSVPEFRLLHDAWKEGTETGRNPNVQEKGLKKLGSDRSFAERAYELILGRPADPGGLQHLVRVMGEGESRTNVVRSLVLSEEFEERYRKLAPEGGFIPRDTQLCELANPAKWGNPDWMKLLRDLKVLTEHPMSMHRKTYEFTQLLYGLQRLDRLREDVNVLSVGAGHECVLYWLANHVGHVVATDLYEGIWQSIGSQEGDVGVLHAPEDYAPFPYRKDRLTFLRMDGLHLAFATGVFDVAYSLSSIEHFGGVPGGQNAIAEMVRVLKPGGLLVVATEYVLEGPHHEETFQPEEIHLLFNHPDLRLIQPIDESVYRRYEYVPVDLYGNRHQTPHMVVRWNDTIFTSVMAFLEKR
jgi:SAM-dependent methyltransferase